jgi:hypothetical protein
MKVLSPAHRYELANFENPDAKGQILQFIEKEGRPLTTVKDGTTNEELLSVLIDRLRALGEKLPCRENALAITKAEECLLWLNKRTADRKARGVEGTHNA